MLKPFLAAQFLVWEECSRVYFMQSSIYQEIQNVFENEFEQQHKISNKIRGGFTANPGC